MSEHFGETTTSTGDSWTPPEQIKSENGARPYTPFATMENPSNPGFEPDLYQPSGEQFELDYPFGNQGYFVPSEIGAPIRSYPPPNAFKVTKGHKEPGRFGYIPSQPLIIPPHGVHVPPNATPPGSAGDTGPMFPGTFAPQGQWQELNPLPAASPPMVYQRARTKTKRAKEASATGPISRTKFSLEEDAKIMKLRFVDGLSWSVIASEYMPHRSEKGLQVHYSVSLKSQSESYNRDWTSEEDEELCRLVSEHQRAMWLVISKRFNNGEVSPTACFARHRFLVRQEEDRLEHGVQTLKQLSR